MAHKTLIGGTAYEISGGKTLVDGTAYSVKNGKTLIGGTIYEIGFGSNAPIILEVEKITSDTYAAETAYTGEQFILLDIYPKKNGTVTVTYGGLTKTITDTSGVENPNAQRVFFGTFNGVSDSVSTPTSGELTIEGDCSNFACASYQNGSKSTSIKYCSCITGVNEWGNVESIMDNAFRECLLLTSINIPNSITSIGNYAFNNCTSLTLTSLPSGLTSIGNYAFNNCTSLALTSLPSGLTTIGSGAFNNCTSLALTSLPSGWKSIVSSAFYGCTNLALTSLPNSITSIESGAFSGCTSLAFTSLPSGLTSIGSYAFNDCIGVSIAEIPANVTTIGDEAFRCTSSVVIYDSLILPKGLLTLGKYCFDTFDANSASVPTNYSRVKNITVLATTPPAMTLDDNSTTGAFGESGKHGITKIVVPKGCGDAYKTTAGWSIYADYIVEAS